MTLIKNVSKVSELLSGNIYEYKRRFKKIDAKIE